MAGEISVAGKLSSKDRGHLASLRLVLQVQLRNLTALWPEGDNQPYDLVVTPDSQKFIKIQVKSCLKQDVQKRHGFIVKRGANHSKTYTKKLVDIIALYAFDTEDWYFIPIEKIEGLTSIHTGGNSKWEGYKNNWEIFN